MEGQTRQTHLSATASLFHTMFDCNVPINESRIRHSVCRWPYDKIVLDDFCKAAVDIGIESIDLLMPEDLSTIAKYDLQCAMISFPTGVAPCGTTVGCIEKAFNRLQYHQTLVDIYEPHMKAAAAGGAKKVICFPGNREGLSDEQGMDNCVKGIQLLLPLAEQLGITLVMELLNSKVDHPDYMCDRTAWGVELCERLDSDHFKLLYDIYHMQIMEGDVIATIRQYHSYFDHYHTGGVPGRGEINASQELFYPAIMQAIVDTGYQGHVAQEFIPKGQEPLESLRKAIRICSI
jgi:hydroxypyruvate isomerase